MEQTDISAERERQTYGGRRKERERDKEREREMALPPYIPTQAYGFLTPVLPLSPEPVTPSPVVVRTENEIVRL